MSGGPYVDRTVLGSVYPTEAVNRVINIDTRFRENPKLTNASDCLVRLPRVYKNITAMRLSSVEIPNNWYDFTSNLENTSFTFNDKICVIPDGNYDAETLSQAISETIYAVSGVRVGVTFNIVNGTCNIRSESNVPCEEPPVFSLNFTPSSLCMKCMTPFVPCGFNVPASVLCKCGGCVSRDASTRPFDTGLGFFLGFTHMVYSGKHSYTSEGITNLISQNYIFLHLERYETLDHVSYNGTSVPVFAKIIVNVDKYNMIYDNGSTTVTNKIQFSEPENVMTLKIKLTDCYGRILPIFGNFSFTLELQEIVSSKLYSAYKDNIVPRGGIAPRL